MNSKCNDSCESYAEKFSGSPCETCNRSTTLADNFKKKRSGLDGLFVGAPVMVNSGNNWVRRKYRTATTILINGKQIFVTDDGLEWDYCRLPTIKESPTNVWLAPHLEISSELLHHHECLFRFKDNSVFDNALFLSRGYSWYKVKAFMILDDLEVKK